MRVQIYEIQSPAEAELCIGLGVDHIGSVILSPEEWKRPEIFEVVKTCRELGAKSSLIPLFIEPDLVARVVDYYRPDFIHLCESLTDHTGAPLDISDIAGRAALLKQRFPEVRVMRSIPVPVAGQGDGLHSLSLARSLEDVSDVFLIDTWLGKEPVHGFIGITGREASRTICRRLVDQSRLPVILAGGLSPENVFDAIMSVRPWGVDSCTLTNMRDQEGRPLRFHKDPEKVRKFVVEASRAFSFCNSHAETLL